MIQDAGVWAFTNASGTNDSTFSENWYNTGATQVATGAPHNNVLSGNVKVSGGNWPSAARQVMEQAGIEPGLRADAGHSALAPNGAAPKHRTS
ncbi:hypothetical protein ACH4TQ_47285 [Streptomyces sp. NPDC021218]|uniref:hypothetical protein n=1 Tax=Streptomyces sp. NPDC021218 TaxID=3365119 RepID=UPI0037B21678